MCASARIVSASARKSIVRYGSSHSPSTPSRMKSAFCRAICVAAYSRHSLRKAFASIPLPCAFSTWCSIGRPWQSQPGTYGASNPDSVLLRTMMSFSTLLTAWPMWMSPFA